MSAPARLTALRLVGFKSFAERTTVEFGSGISAVVGPNGSGKSNLADALRWTLGEAGRSLRTRRAEDVIFAGSSTRKAVGMADVTLVIDNGDRLLPVDYGEVELGRRLYRSGENEYLLNRQRVRLRDLLELLDAGNLADNAFLFIGQGMVDQALALRPEERRPLFEEAAGVRRHERRRRHAEAELAEAENNLERLRDVLAELRPHARRLAAQAEQLHARQTAGTELADALVASARGRWRQSAATAAAAQSELEAAHAQADAAMTELRVAEEQAEDTTRRLGERVEEEQRQRHQLEGLRSELLELRLGRERLAGQLEAADRDRRRLDQERDTLAVRASEARAVLARTPSSIGEDSFSELDEVERDLRRLENELALAERDATTADESAARAAREASERAAEVERRQRRADELRLRREELRRELEDRQRAEAESVTQRDQAVAAIGLAAEAEKAAETAADAARRGLDAALARNAERERALVDIEARRAAVAARLEQAEAAVAAGVGTALLRAARARGGSLAAEGLEVDQQLRAAVAAALGDVAGAVAVDEAVVKHLREAAGVVVLSGEGGRAHRADGRSLGSEGARVLAAVAALEGGLLRDAVRRDPAGHVTRLLARVAWVPDLERALQLRRELPAGWSVATLDGELATEAGIVRLAGAGDVLDRRAQRDELARELARLQEAFSSAESEAAQARASRREASDAWEAARNALDRRRREHRLAAEAERSTQRRAEAALRERAWLQAQLERLDREATEAATALAEAEKVSAAASSGGSGGAVGASSPNGADMAPLRRHVEMLRQRRDRLAAARREAEAQRQAREDERRTAQLALSFADSRATELDVEARSVAVREADLRAELDRLAGRLAAVEDAELRARGELERLLAGGADERSTLREAERAALAARERLRAAESRSRAAEVRATEARLHLEQIREQLLVELASIGPDGLSALGGVTAGADGEMPAHPAGGDLSPDVLGTQLERALDRALPAWASSSDTDPPPSVARLGALRRRFHELGASNPFAAQEYDEVRARLESMEAQRADLEAAIRSTRELISDLSALITDQFRRTFAALEGAFARRFQQLFDGGEAQLSLTAPEDLSATGVEITARPPGKKRQPLAMLSGGERALTAVALLLAMLEVRPVPFCVLDEVDAALDEANISRFSAALRGLADRIQFIVITHNRGTIEAADALYGVTIGDDAVSRIVSLRLPPENGHDRANGVLAATAVTDG